MTALVDVLTVPTVATIQLAKVYLLPHWKTTNADRSQLVTNITIFIIIIPHPLKKEKSHFYDGLFKSLEAH